MARCKHWIQVRNNIARYRCNVDHSHKVHKAMIEVFVASEDKPFPGTTVAEITWRED